MIELKRGNEGLIRFQYDPIKNSLELIFREVKDPLKVVNMGEYGVSRLGMGKVDERTKGGSVKDE